MKRAISHWSPILVGLLLLGLLGYMQRDRALAGQNDFSQLYTAGKLVGTQDLYSREANLKVIQNIHGFTMETVVYTRPPFYALLLRPLAALPYLTAYWIFSMASLGCMLWFVIRFARECPPLPFFAAFSIPLISTLCAGQDTAFLLPVIGGAVLLHRKDRHEWAGALLSLGAIKFHLLLFVPVLLVFNRQWRVLRGGACGVVVLFVAGVLANGWDSSQRYIAVLTDPWINPSADIMPNLHGLAASLGWGATAEAAMSAAVLCLFAWMTTRTASFEMLVALALVCGLLTSVHSGVPDDVLLLPAFVLILGASDNAPLRAISALVLTPLPYLMVLAGKPFSAAFPLALLVLLAAAALSLVRVPAPASAPAAN